MNPSFLGVRGSVLQRNLKQCHGSRQCHGSDLQALPWRQRAWSAVMEAVLWSTASSTET